MPSLAAEIGFDLSYQFGKCFCTVSANRGIYDADLQSHSNAVTALAEQGEVKALRPGKKLVRQGDATNDIYFILCGRLVVKRNNGEITDRGAGDCLGEMALILTSHWD